MNKLPDFLDRSPSRYHAVANLCGELEKAGYTRHRGPARRRRAGGRAGDGPAQHFANRSDLPGGGTLGLIANTRVSVNAVDIGLAQLAVHSCFETAGVRDTDCLIRAMTAFYGVSFREENERFMME